MEESDRLRSLRCGRKRALQKKKEIEKQKEDERRREFEIQQALRKQQEDRQKQRAIIEQERQRQSVINNQNPFTDSPAPARTVPQSPIQNKEEVTTFGPFSAFKNFPSFPRNVLDNQSLEQGIETNSRPALRGPNLLPTRPTGPPPPQRIQPKQTKRSSTTKCAKTTTKGSTQIYSISPIKRSCASCFSIFERRKRRTCISFLTFSKQKAFWEKLPRQPPKDQLR